MRRGEERWPQAGLRNDALRFLTRASKAFDALPAGSKEFGGGCQVNAMNGAKAISHGFGDRSEPVLESTVGDALNPVDA
jgi:hypothetical protein